MDFIYKGVKSTNMMMYKASHVLYYFENEKTFWIVKNRHGKPGSITSDYFLDLILDLVAKAVYSNTAIVFQEGFKQEMKKALFKVFKKHAIKVVNKDDTL